MLKKIKWTTIDKGKYLILYDTVPNYIIAKIKAKTKIPGVNECRESDVYLFSNFSEAEKFFKELVDRNEK